MFDAISVLHDLNIPYITRGKNLSYGRLGVCCPWCHDRGYHGAFTANGQIYTCWKCGWHPTIDTLMEMSNQEYYYVSSIINEHTDGGVITWKRNKASGKQVKLIGGKLDKRHRAYLESRGYDPDELVQKYGITGTNQVEPNDWANRIIIPIYYKRELISYQGRDITGLSPIRYKFLPLEESAKDPKSVLYNIDNCKKDYVALVEGAFKAIRFGSDCVSPFGVNMRESQYRLLLMYKKVYIIFDPDDAGRKNAKAVGDKLSSLGIEVEIIDLEDKPIDDMSMDEIKYLRKELDFV